jgi:mannitol-1-phosphate 5-dehydrogenase
MKEHIFVGFGFGPIQAGLFIKEAFQSGNFARFVVAEIDERLVDTLRANQGSYYINVAHTDRIETIPIPNIELLNPKIDKDREKLLQALAEATEIVTSLPSVDFYDAGTINNVSSLIAQGIKNSQTKATIVYTAENHNRAAEILQKIVIEKTGALSGQKVQFLNTVIGKMSQVVTDAAEMKELNLTPIVDGIDRAFLVEEFNRILVSRTQLADFDPGIDVFIEKDDLLPFEEAKLYGHNAIHAMLAYLGFIKNYKKMTELKDDQEIMRIVRQAFLQESGEALIRKYGKMDDSLFTPGGYQAYADDLLTRMTNPLLADTIERAGRDPLRKLGYSDRIFGTMTLALEYGIEPVNMALGGLAGIIFLLAKAKECQLSSDLRIDSWQNLKVDNLKKITRHIWNADYGQGHDQLVKYLWYAHRKLVHIK